METVAQKLEYWNQQVANAQKALEYCIGQRVMLLEQILAADEHMAYSDPIERVHDLDRTWTE